MLLPGSQQHDTWWVRPAGTYLQQESNRRGAKLVHDAGGQDPNGKLWSPSDAERRPRRDHLRHQVPLPRLRPRHESPCATPAAPLTSVPERLASHLTAKKMPIRGVLQVAMRSYTAV